MSENHVNRTFSEDKYLESKGTKRHSDEASGIVHSANAWESSDLGNDGRKQKFLRLMGADKKDHHGRFIIGDQDSAHGTTTDDIQKVTSDLEEQFTQGMEHRLSGKARSHTGLGFVAPKLNTMTEPSSVGDPPRETRVDGCEDNKLKVHSSNDWEHADLSGDGGRKEKFLRLMGAGKNEHHGKFVIGDHAPTHTGQGVDARKVEGELEGQFLEGAEHKTAGSSGSRTGYGYPHQDTGDSKQGQSTGSSSSRTGPRPSVINFVKGSS